MAKKLMEHAGGKNSMAFGMGKSNAKIYVQSSEGIRFSDVAGEDEAKENLLGDQLISSQSEEVYRCRSLNEKTKT